MPHFDDLALYYRPSCPYCIKVLRFMESHAITLELKNIAESDNLNTLVEVGGSRQVPCLFISGKAMYESDDIIDYLRQRIS